MSKSSKLPKYALHRASGQARVLVNGKHIYLGKFGSVESQQKCADIITKLASESLAAISDLPSGQFPDLTIDDLLLRYLQFARSYYCEAGVPSKEYRCMTDAIKHLRPRYGTCSAQQFGPRKLAIVREDMILQGLARTVINNRINRIRRVFKWGVSMELISPSVFHGICSLEGLKFGRSKARESGPVQAVSDDQIELVVNIASPQIRAMILLQRYTGMRPGEVVIMRPCDIETGESPWLYEPHTHKNKYRGHRREVYLGPKSQELLKPFLDRDPNAFLFSPYEAESWRNQQRQQQSLPDEKRVEVVFWHPHQLRHQFATVVRRELGAEAVQIGLGHKSTNLVDLYAEKNRDAGMNIARELG